MRENPPPLAFDKEHHERRNMHTKYTNDGCSFQPVDCAVIKSAYTL
jgi:hypothetical protein